jgi:hypothetical protein
LQNHQSTAYKNKNIKIKKMNFLEITLSNRTMLILGALSGIAIIFITFLIAKRYNKKTNAIK